MSNDNRPVNINLMKIKLPIAALVSITHRLAGMYIFFVTLPLSIYLFNLSILSEVSFTNLVNLLSTNVLITTFVSFSYLVLFYHILTGVRHLIMDMHIGESLSASRASSILVITIWFLTVIYILALVF